MIKYTSCLFANLLMAVLFTLQTQATEPTIGEDDASPVVRHMTEEAAPERLGMRDQDGVRNSRLSPCDALKECCALEFYPPVLAFNCFVLCRVAPNPGDYWPQLLGIGSLKALRLYWLLTKGDGGNAAPKPKED